MIRQHHLITGTIALAAALTASLAPAAWAEPAPLAKAEATIAAPGGSAHGAQSGWVVRPNPDQQNPPPAPVRIVRVSDPNGGFDSGDAGIGAAGALGLILAATGGTLLVRRRNDSGTRTNVPAAS